MFPMLVALTLLLNFCFQKTAAYVCVSLNWLISQYQPQSSQDWVTDMSFQHLRKVFHIFPITTDLLASRNKEKYSMVCPFQ